MKTHKKFKDFYEEDDWGRKDSKRYDKKRKAISEGRKKKDSFRESYWSPKEG